MRTNNKAVANRKELINYTAGDNIIITDGVISASGGEQWETLTMSEISNSNTSHSVSVLGFAPGHRYRITLDAGTAIEYESYREFSKEGEISYYFYLEAPVMRINTQSIYISDIGDFDGNVEIYFDIIHFYYNSVDDSEGRTLPKIQKVERLIENE